MVAQLYYPSSIFSCQRSRLHAAKRAAAKNPRSCYSIRGVAAGLGGAIKIRMVEIAGIEPATSGLQSRRSPN